MPSNKTTGPSDLPRFYWFPRAQIPGGDVFSDASAANFLHRTLVEAKLMSKKDAKQDTVGL